MSLLLELDEKGSFWEDTQRIWIQEIVFVAQQLGLRIGYSFRWKNIGPYSPDLTDDGFEMLSLPRKIWKDLVNLEELQKETVDRLRTILNSIKESFSDIEKYKAMQLFASLLFLVRCAYPKEKTRDTAQETLKKYQDFDPEQLEKAWQLLESYKLVG
ncbi:MAG: hypothetical protein GF411_20445 [Candidatus Lokiarchaeota archaeon]|nr:hypothetical protein [Candidatus Lokiarchaeota archaeon]